MTPSLPHRRAAWLLVVATASACSSPPREHGAAVEHWQARTVSARAADDATRLETPADLAALLAWADAHNPALQAAAQRWKAALERVSVAGALPDPQLTFGYYLDEVQTRTGPMQWRVGLQQPLPWFGELDRADEAALAEARALAARYEAERAALFADIRDGWAELAWAQAAARVTAGHRELIANWEQVARTRYATGLGAEADLIRAQIELGTLEDRSRSLEDLQRPLVARLNARLDRQAAASLPPVALAERHAAPDEDALRARLPLENPELAALDEHVRAAEARLALAATDAWPDAAVGLDFTRIGKGGDDALALTGGLSLPIRRGRIRAGIARAEAELAALHAERRDLANRLAARLEQQLYAWRDAERRLTLYRDTLLPKGHESVQAISAAYQSGDSGFLDLIDAERVLLEFELAVARARSDREQARAAIDALLGADPDMLETGP